MTPPRARAVPPGRVTSDPCAKCGANLALVGRAHRCELRLDHRAPMSKPVANPKRGTKGAKR